MWIVGLWWKHERESVWREGGNSNTTAQKGGCVLFNWTNLITILSHYLSARLLESEGISLELDIFFSIFTLPSIHHHQHTFKPNVFFVAFFFFNEFLLLSFPTRKCQAPIMLSCTWIKFFRHEDNCTHTSTLGSNPELDPMH